MYRDAQRKRRRHQHRQRPAEPGTSWASQILLVWTVSCAFVVAMASPAYAQEVLVSAAISMKNVAEEVGRHFQATHAGVRLQYNFGASGDLQKQIEAGAPVDVFLSAGQRQMDELEKRGLLRPGSRRVFARNVITLIVPKDSRLDLGTPADLLRPQVRRVVVGNPKTVPAGQYAEESLRSLRLWDALHPKLIFAENVRQALEYVARGEVDAGFVYRTDAALRVGQVKEAGQPPQESYPPVMYPGAVVATSKQPALAQAFLDLLLGAAGQEVLARYGFHRP